MKTHPQKTYKIVGMHCASCATMIEIEFEDLGVVAKCNFAKETLTIENPKKDLKEQEILEIVRKSGYEIAKD